MQFLKLISSSPACSLRKSFYNKKWVSPFTQGPSLSAGDVEVRELVQYIDSLKNYEKSGVPKDAGTDSDDGFDLGRMRRLMGRLGNPDSRFKVCSLLQILFHCSSNLSLFIKVNVFCPMRSSRT